MFSKKRGAALLLAGCLTAAAFTGCSFTDNQALVKIDGGKDKITYGYANFNARLTQAMYDVFYKTSNESSYENLWTQASQTGKGTMESVTKSQILDEIKTAYYLTENAKDYGVSLTSDEKKEIKKTARTFMKENSKAAKKQLGAKEEYVERYLEDQLYTQKMEAAIEAKADTTVTDEEANMKTIHFVYFSDQVSTGSDGNLNVPSDDDIAKSKAAAEAIAAASDFDSAVTANGGSVETYSYDAADLKKAKKKGTVTISSGTSLPYDVLKAVDGLSDGQSTDVVYVKNSGYYVAYMNATTDQEKTESNRTSLQTEKKTDYYESTLKKMEAKSTWKLNKSLWKKVRFINRFKGTLIDQSTDSKSSTDSTGSTDTSTGTDSSTDSSTGTTSITNSTSSDSTGN
jgi:foldase protein PrsA